MPLGSISFVVGSEACARACVCLLNAMTLRINQASIDESPKLLTQILAIPFHNAAFKKKKIPETQDYRELRSRRGSLSRHYWSAQAILMYAPPALRRVMPAAGSVGLGVEFGGGWIGLGEGDAIRTKDKPERSGVRLSCQRKRNTGVVASSETERRAVE